MESIRIEPFEAVNEAPNYGRYVKSIYIRSGGYRIAARIMTR